MKTVEEFIKQTNEPIRDMMDGTYMITPSHTNKSTRFIIINCVICGRVGAKFGVGKHIKLQDCGTYSSCRVVPKKTRKFKGMTFTINDVPNYVKRKWKSDPLKSYVQIMKNRDFDMKHRIKYFEDPVKAKEYKKKWLADTKKRKAASDKKYRSKPSSKAKAKEYHRQYRAKNAEAISKRTKQWCKDNAETLKVKKAHYRKTTIRTDESITRQKIQTQIWAVLKRYKDESDFYNGYHNRNIDINACVTHLVSLAKDMGKTINDIKSTHHIDHIMPMYYYRLEEFHKAYSPINLRWLPAKENMGRGYKLRPEDIKVIKTLPREIYPKSWNGVIPTNY